MRGKEPEELLIKKAKLGSALYFNLMEQTYPQVNFNNFQR